MLEINIKRYLKIIHIFSSAKWHLAREIFDLAIENLNKAKRLKNTEADGREAFKWEINIKNTFKKKPMYLEMKCPLLNDESKKIKQGKLESFCTIIKSKTVITIIVECAEAAQCN